MSATSGGPGRKRRRDSDQAPDIINLSSDDDSVIDLTNETNILQNMPTRHPHRLRSQVESDNRNRHPPARSQMGQENGHLQSRVRAQVEEGDSDDDIEILSVNISTTGSMSSDTNRAYFNTMLNADSANTLDEHPNRDDDLEITDIQRAPSPLAHIDTPMGHIPYQPEPGLVSYQNARQQPFVNPYSSPRNVRRRMGHIPAPHDSQGTRLLPPRNNLGPHAQIPPQRRRQHPHNNSHDNTNMTPITNARRQSRTRGRSARNQHPLPRTSRRGPQFAHGHIPDFVSRINFSLESVSDFLPHVFFPNMFGRDVSSEVFENSIMQRIEEDNNRAVDARMEREKNYNRKSMAEKQKLADVENAKGTHTNKINSSDNLVCELCGVALGEGAPVDFKGDPKYDLNFEKYAEQYQTQAPWFCVNPFTDADHDLSKRIFASKCGHTFCGRCVKNIAGRPARKPKDAPSGFTVKNPSIYAPTKCPAKDCGKKFVSKAFTEVYF